MVLIIFTQYHILNIHASIAAMAAAADESAGYCGRGFETTALSDYHTPEHKRASDLGGKP